MRAGFFLCGALLFCISCSSGTKVLADGDGSTTEADTPQTDHEETDGQDMFLADGDELLADDAGPQAEFPDEGYPSPEPGTCDFIGANCGEVTIDGDTISCGECADPDTCGGGGTPNVCGHPLCDEGWCWEHPYPQGDDLNDIYALDATHVWAVGDSVALFYNGVSWERIPYQLRQGGRIQAIYAADADHVWAVATDGCILFLNEEGLLTCDREIDEQGFPTHWTETKNALYDIHGTGPNDIWAAGNGILLHWDGTSWNIMLEPFVKLFAVWAVAPGISWAGGEAGLFYHDTENWSRTMTDIVVRDIFALSPDDIWAVGDEGAILHYDNMLGWHESYSMHGGDNLFAAGALSKELLFVAGANGWLWRHLGWGGMERQPIALQGALRAMSVAQGKMWLAGDHGFIGSWDTKFFSTNRQRLPDRARSLFANSPFDVWAAGDKFFAHWNGTAWRFMASHRTITDLYGDAYDNIYAETTEGIYLHYDGTRWSTAEPDEATVSALKTAREPLFSRPDGETVRWCFEEGDCWSFTGLRFMRDLPTEEISSFEWPFEGFLVWEGSKYFPINICIDGAGRYWGTDATRLVSFENGKWRHIELDLYFGHATALTCKEDTLYVADNNGRVWQVIDNEPVEVAKIENDLSSISHILDLSTDGTLYAMLGNTGAHGVLYRIVEGIAEKVTIPGDPPLLSFAAISDSDIWAGGFNSLYHWDGSEWTMTLPADLTDRGLPAGETEVNLTRIFALDADNIWMLGSSPDKATAYIFSYDGTKWVNDARTSLYGELAFTDVWATDQQNAYITMNAEGWIYHYKNLGAVGMIDHVDAPAGTPFGAIAGRDGEEMRIFAPGGAILVYRF